MANKMLIDASHPEETRVVVVRGNRVEDFDFESQSRRPLRGNIYLAKVTRVEPSLQAAFVEYGGNRHGFLAFSAIHPDYYQIPVADRQALLEEQARAAEDEEEAEDRRDRRNRRHRPARTRKTETVTHEASESEVLQQGQEQDAKEPSEGFANQETEASSTYQDDDGEETAGDDDNGDSDADDNNGSEDESAEDSTSDNGEEQAEEQTIESLGSGDALEEAAEPRRRLPPRRYKIQEVIKRRQVLLIQVVKEERGNKGAALTTYLSLAGRYSVLMPNSGRGGGISRKISSAADRKRLKEMMQDLDVPEGMGVILRTAGASRTRTEIKRDFEYLLRMWEQVRDLTLKSIAPTLVYEEGSLIKRSIRDLYNKDIDEVLVDGEAGCKEARDFMRMLMPSHARHVKLYQAPQPIFTGFGVENQLDAMFSPTVHLRSGGYIVINQTEALVAIDINSGRSTREHNIEDTALKTNLEAAEEIARQLRLRDLAGLIVIDFIDMEERRNNRAVERRLNDCLKNDRARIQLGRISPFGLLEMSRQRIRTGVLESSTVTCPHCNGAGHIRSASSIALQVLRQIEDTLLKSPTHDLTVRTRTDVALYVLNNKRAHLRMLEERFAIQIAVIIDDSITGALPVTLDRGEQVRTLEEARALLDRIRPEKTIIVEESEDDLVEDDEIEEAEEESQNLPTDEEDASSDDAEKEDEEDTARNGRKRRRRRGRGRARSDDENAQTATDEETEDSGETSDASEADEDEDGEDKDHKRRRRGRRGGRRNRRRSEQTAETDTSAADTSEAATQDDDRHISMSPPQAPVAASIPARVQQTAITAPPPPVVERSQPPAVSSEPVLISSAADQSKPRKGGWWMKKILG